MFPCMLDTADSPTERLVADKPRAALIENGHDLMILCARSTIFLVHLVLQKM
jgi:hypothetical protein